MEMTWTTTAVAAACAMAVVMSVPVFKRMLTRAHHYACEVATGDRPHRGMRLPLGSMGLPCLGETITLKSQRHNFWISRQQL